MAASQPAPVSLGEKIARQREDRADFCERTAGHHAGSVWAYTQQQQARQWRAAAARARAGDLTPFTPY